jgi:hypothetical protein
MAVSLGVEWECCYKKKKTYCSIKQCVKQQQEDISPTFSKNY